MALGITDSDHVTAGLHGLGQQRPDHRHRALQWGAIARGGEIVRRPHQRWGVCLRVNTLADAATPGVKDERTHAIDPPVPIQEPLLGSADRPGYGAQVGCHPVGRWRATWHEGKGTSPRQVFLLQTNTLTPMRKAAALVVMIFGLAACSSSQPSATPSTQSASKIYAYSLVAPLSVSPSGLVARAVLPKGTACPQLEVEGAD